MTDRWDVSTREGYLEWYDATVHVAHRSARRLCGADWVQAEDLVHDAYLAILRNARAGTLTEATVGLVTTAIRNRFIDGVRSGASEQRRVALVHATMDQSVDHVDDGADLLRGLAPRDRLALLMRYVDGCSVSEVAEALGCSVHAAESVLTRARARARMEVSRDD